MKKNSLLKKIVIVLLLVSTNLMAQEKSKTQKLKKNELQYGLNNCGTYRAFGKAEKIRDEFFLTFFKDSKSEIKLQIIDSTNMKLLPYLDKEVEVKIEISQLPEFQKGNASIHSISDSTLTAIHVEDRQGFMPIKESPCLTKNK